MIGLPCSQCGCTGFVGAGEARFCSDCGHPRDAHRQPSPRSGGAAAQATEPVEAAERAEEPVAVREAAAPESPKTRRPRRWLIVAGAVALVGAVSALGLVFLGKDGPSVSGTTPGAKRAARLLLSDKRAPAGITGVSCKVNTDDWASGGFSTYRCEVAARGGRYVCDAGPTTSGKPECDSATHYEYVRAETLALAQRALDAINRDQWRSAFVSELASSATGKPFCTLYKELRPGPLEDAIVVVVYARAGVTGAGLGDVVIVPTDGRIQDVPYQGAYGDELGRPVFGGPLPLSQHEFAIGVCSVSASGLAIDKVLIRPGTTPKVGVAQPSSPATATTERSDASVLRSAKLWRACVYAWGNFSEPGKSPYDVAQTRALADDRRGYKTHAKFSWTPRPQKSVITNETCLLEVYFPASNSIATYRFFVPRDVVSELFGPSGTSNTFSHDLTSQGWQLDSLTESSRPAWYPGNAVGDKTAEFFRSDAEIGAYLQARGYAKDDPTVFRETPMTPSPSANTYNGRDFSISYPVNFVVSAGEVNKGSYYDTTILGPRGSNELIRVNENASSVHGTVNTMAAPVLEALRSQSGYREVSLQHMTFQSWTALRWEFEVPENGVLLHKVDLFFMDRNRRGWAILTQAPASRYGSVASEFDAIQRSFTAP